MTSPILQLLYYDYRPYTEVKWWKGQVSLFRMKLLNVTITFLSNSSFSSFRVFSNTTFSLKPLLSTLFVSTFSRARMQPPSARLCAAVCSSSLCCTIFDAIIIVQFPSSSSSCFSTSIPVMSKSVADKSPGFTRIFMFTYKTEYFAEVLPFWHSSWTSQFRSSLLSWDPGLYKRIWSFNFKILRLK